MGQQTYAGVGVLETALPPVVFTVDEAYCLPLVVAWQSLCESNPQMAAALEIVVLHEGLGREAEARLCFHANRLGLHLNLMTAHLPDLPYNLDFGGARANYLRLAIPANLVGRERVVYLDADIVVRGDIRPLLQADLNGMAFGAVCDALNPTYETGRALPAWRSLGIPGDREYFNSGVLVVDRPACDRDGIFDRALQAVADHPEQLRLWDQDALNVAAEDRWCRLPRAWNTVPFSALRLTPWIRYRAEHLVPADDLVAAEATAAIMHYVSPSKPWRGLLPDGPANALYQHHLDVVRRAEAEQCGIPSEERVST